MGKSTVISYRTFGVEIECGHDDYEPEDVYDLLTAEGLEFEDVVSDGSGIEIKTPILKGNKGYNALTKLLNFLNQEKFYVTRSDGMHVHIGAAFLHDDPDAGRRLASLWLNNQKLIVRMCSSHRSGPHAYNQELRPSHIENIGEPSRLDCRKNCKHPQHRGYKYWPGRYNINFSALHDYGTIEFRIHEGCLDPVKAVAWVQFCQKIIDYIASGKEVRSCQYKREFLQMLEVSPEVISTLSKKQKLMSLAPTRVYAQMVAP